MEYDKKKIINSKIILAGNYYICHKYSLYERFICSIKIAFIEFQHVVRRSRFRSELLTTVLESLFDIIRRRVIVILIFHGRDDFGIAL